MVQPLIEALRNLTIALREFRASEHWEIVDHEGARAFEEATFELAAATSLVDRPRNGTSAAPAVAEAATSGVTGTSSPTPTQDTWGADIRHYVVLSNPGSGKVGYISGPSSSTWCYVESTLKGGRLSGSGARLRRVEDRSQAAAAWATAYPGRPMPDFPRQ